MIKQLVPVFGGSFHVGWLVLSHINVSIFKNLFLTTIEN